MSELCDGSKWGCWAPSELDKLSGNRLYGSDHDVQESVCVGNVFCVQGRKLRVKNAGANTIKQRCWVSGSVAALLSVLAASPFIDP